MSDAQAAAVAAIVAEMDKVDLDIATRLTYCEHWIGGAVILLGFVLTVLTAGLIRKGV